VPPLDGALALAEVHDVAERVPEHLELDVPRVAQEFLEVDVRDAERRLRLGARRGQTRRQLGGGVDHAHAAPAAAGARLDDHRVADARRDASRVLVVLDRALAAREDRHARRLRLLARLRLVPHQPDDVRAGADEADLAGFAHLGEVGRFGQEPVAGVDGVGVGDLRRGDDRADLEVRVDVLRRADADVLVGEADVQRVAVGGRVDRHRLDAELAAGPDDPQRDLAAIGDEDFPEHRRALPGPR